MIIAHSDILSHCFNVVLYMKWIGINMVYYTLPHIENVLSMFACDWFGCGILTAEPCGKSRTWINVLPKSVCGLANQEMHVARHH